MFYESIQKIKVAPIFETRCITCQR